MSSSLWKTILRTKEKSRKYIWRWHEVHVKQNYIFHVLDLSSRKLEFPITLQFIIILSWLKSALCLHFFFFKIYSPVKDCKIPVCHFFFVSQCQLVLFCFANDCLNMHTNITLKGSEMFCKLRLNQNKYLLEEKLVCYCRSEWTVSKIRYIPHRVK